MYVSNSQIVTSLARLTNVHPFFGFAFFGFKKADLPVGGRTTLSYTFLEHEILDNYFKPRPDFDRYFNPFKTTSRWVSDRYVSTSLQRVIADTFAEAFLHAKGSSEWGWAPDYVSKLQFLMEKSQTARIPALDIAVWFYRKEPFPGADIKGELVDRLVSDFSLSQLELSALFDTLISGRTIDVSDTPTSDVDLLNAIGWPEGSEESAGVTLRLLELLNVGPSSHLRYSPSARLNLITGDNSLGKSFLLDCAWWAITGEWTPYAAEPSRHWRGPAEIRYSLASRTGRAQDFIAPFKPLEAIWQRPPSPFNGLALFSKFDGQISLWDPARNNSSRVKSLPTQLLFSRDAIWNGLTVGRDDGRQTFVSNGLVRDCVSWQNSKPHHGIFESLQKCLLELSPPDGPPLKFGKATKVHGDSREMPTISMPYGDVPVLFASAGIQRILALAYMLTWSWYEHLENSKEAEKRPNRHITILLDEIEAHLHPKWQRQIMPALVKTLQSLIKDAAYQIHVASHSPLVLASIEPIFSRDTDRIHRLSLENTDVTLSKINFVKHGSVDAWLESDVFGLEDARNKPAEVAVAHAKELQLQKSPQKSHVEAIHQELSRLLPDDDPFWVRWNYFYENLNNPDPRNDKN